MNIMVHLALVVAVCLCVAEAAPDGRYARKQQRPTRGFKNVEMMAARGFGKRARAELFGLDNFWENLEASQEKDGQDATEDKIIESIPMEWFVNEMINNADFAQSVVRKFIDINQDGILSSEELLRNV